MPVQETSHAGWSRNLALANDSAELILSLEVGPRVLSYRPQSGSNIFYNYPAHLGGSGESKWMNRGGHRIWIAPENELTYQLDNEPFPYEIIGEDTVRLVSPAKGRWNIRKELTLQLTASGGVIASHVLINEGPEAHSVAPWALSVMCQGGLSILPQPPLGDHPRDLLPNRSIIFWPYTDVTDPRLKLGRKFVTLAQDQTRLPIKFGLAHRGKWAAYLCANQLFIKTVPWIEDATYPDFGCNYESYTDQDMLEIETLGPLTNLAPGDSVVHVENWSIFGELTPPPFTDSPAFAEWLQPYLP